MLSTQMSLNLCKISPGSILSCTSNHKCENVDNYKYCVSFPWEEGGGVSRLMIKVSSTFVPCRNTICRDDLYEHRGQGSPQRGSPASVTKTC